MDETDTDYSHMGRRPDILIESCLAGIINAAGGDLECLRERTIGLGRLHFKTLDTLTDVDKYRTIDVDGAPPMTGRTYVRNDLDEIVGEVVRMGDHCTYRGRAEDPGSPHSPVRIEVRQKVPETIMAAMRSSKGMPLRSIIAHEWLQDDAIRVKSVTETPDGFDIEIDAIWTRIEHART